MRCKMWISKILLLLLVQFIVALPLTTMADEESVTASYVVSDVALTPGADATKLNFAWHTSDDSAVCIIEVLEKPEPHMKHQKHPMWGNFHKKPVRFYGTNVGPDVNPDGDYYNEVTVKGLKMSTEYLYRLGDGDGNWSDVYEFSTGDPRKYSFIYLADSQIGASVPKNATAEQKAEAIANDTAGWVNTVDIIDSNFPQAAFILSGGDQVELPAEEMQWTGFFSAPELASIPIAPTIGSHDDFLNGRGGTLDTTVPNFNYHFNLPNESTVSGVSAAGGDYYFTYGDVLYINLNMDPQIASYTMLPPGSACDPTETMDCSDHEAFMQEAVSANPHTRWKIVTWHYSIYSSGMHAQDCNIIAMRETMYPIIDALDIDVVFMGHDHCFARSYQMLANESQIDQMVGMNGEIINPTGTLYFTANSSSGSKYYGLYSDVANLNYLSVYSQLYVPSFSYVSIDKHRLTISTYRTDTMEMTDTYTIVKHHKKPWPGWEWPEMEW